MSSGNKTLTRFKIRETVDANRIYQNVPVDTSQKKPRRAQKSFKNRFDG
jgi:hypothetical protein